MLPLVPAALASSAGGGSPASGRLARALAGNGERAVFVLPSSLVAGRYTVQVVGRGEAYNGWPTVTLRSGGRSLGTATIDAGTPVTRRLGTLDLTGGQVLEVVFTNDAYGGPGRDRNVIVEHLRLTPAGGPAAGAARAALLTPAVPGPRIMPLGDSITDGYNIPGGYRIELHRKLAAQAPGIDLVGSLENGPANLADRDHEGHSGWRIDELAAHVDGWLDRARPDTVLLMIGTNDMIQNRDPAGAPERLGRLLDQMFSRRPGMRILVASLPPLADTEQNRRAREYNAALPALVRSRAAQGKKISFVDAGAALSLADLADGVHPNAVGYRKLADVWFEALRRTPGALRP